MKDKALVVLFIQTPILAAAVVVAAMEAKAAMVEQRVFTIHRAAVAATVAMARTAHQAAAAVEGAAAVANPFMWPNLAIAGAAMGAVYATFQFASGEWQLPQVDISSISQREAAAQRLAVVQ